MYHDCIEQCEFGRWKLTKTIMRYRSQKNKKRRKPRLGLLIAIGAESTTVDTFVKASDLLYELKDLFPEDSKQEPSAPGLPPQ